MKCSETWLREWINSSLTREELANVLTMGGLEVESLTPLSTQLNQVMIGKIISIIPNKNSSLRHCEVDVGQKDLVTILTGASNAKVGVVVALAFPGAILPNGVTVHTRKFGDVTSQGMILSAGELDFDKTADGILVLPDDAPLGRSLWDYLRLDDYIFDIAITPNRSDCLSIKGISREIAALTNTTWQPLEIPAIAPQIDEKLPVSVLAPDACPKYVGRMIRNIKADTQTPVWLSERLRRSGIRSIHPVVDVTNYVMLELGQPLHAFDLKKIHQGIVIRYAHHQEPISLLDGSQLDLNETTLIIADEEKPLAIAGIMGGIDSSVTLNTTDIFIESAYFSPSIIARERQRYGLLSDSSYRFERGIDPRIQVAAIVRATDLILQFCGGQPSDIIEYVSPTHLPQLNSIPLSCRQVSDVLGVNLTRDQIQALLDRLKISSDVRHEENIDLMINVPSHRLDLVEAEDVIEEIARLFGYENIPIHPINATLQFNQPENKKFKLIRQCLVNCGCHEIVSYSFVDADWQKLLNPDVIPKNLLNPISQDMAMMRTNLWPGLLQSVLFNKNRQAERVRLFEIGNCFEPDAGQWQQSTFLAGVFYGFAFPEQWNNPKRCVDFYDVKGLLEILVRQLHLPGIEYRSWQHPALHPGQTAGIYQKDIKIGCLGALHPQIAKKFDVENVFLWEIALDLAKYDEISQFKEISKFPHIQRDLAILIDYTIPAKVIQDTIETVAGDWLKEVFIFDVYQGKGIEPGLKSIAVRLILQHSARTLVDDEVSELMIKIIHQLKEQLGAELRS